MRALGWIAAGLLCACHQQAPAAQDTRPPLAAAPLVPSVAVAPSASVAPLPEVKRTTGVVIDAQGIRLDTDVQPIVALGANPSLGADSAYKRSGPNDLYLVPLADALKREVAAGRISTPLRMVVAATTTYRILIEVLFTAGQSEIGAFEICEDSCEKRKLSFETPHPSPDRLNPGMRHGLNLVAIITADGVGLKASGGNIAPGCNDVGRGLTVPRVGAALDLASVASCASKLKAADPAFATEDQATLVATAPTPLREVMDLALTLQGPHKALFPKIMFGVPR